MVIQGLSFELQSPKIELGETASQTHFNMRMMFAPGGSQIKPVSRGLTSEFRNQKSVPVMDRPYFPRFSLSRDAGEKMCLGSG